jgi:protein-tyrosine-phosphatase
MAVVKTLGDLTREMTAAETASRAAGQFGGTSEGLAKEYQRNTQALKMLRDNNLISEQSYADQSVMIESKKLDAILQLDQANAAARMKLAGVTNQAVITAVQDQQKNVQMIQQGGITGFQGMLGAIDNVMSSMSGQSKKAFEAHKALATAQALISTYQAAAMAIAFPPGPPISFIYVAGAIAAGMAQIAAIQSQQYSGKKVGGGVMNNTPYIVGENGPELFTPSSSGQITPTDKLGGGGPPVNINFTINAVDTAGFDNLLVTRRGVIQQIVSDAMTERGQRGL